LLVVRRLILRDLGDPGADRARRAGLVDRAARIEEACGRDGGRRLVEQAFRRR
jgi:hypothetical protein